MATVVVRDPATAMDRDQATLMARDRVMIITGAMGIEATILTGHRESTHRHVNSDRLHKDLVPMKVCLTTLTGAAVVTAADNHRHRCSVNSLRHHTDSSHLHHMLVAAVDARQRLSIVAGTVVVDVVINNIHQ